MKTPRPSAERGDAAPEPLRIRLLGELRVTRGEARVALPPSRKTRGLLAYLLLTGRSHRRERLCSLLWDVTDDPRGALRWSLSKLRALVNDADEERIVATRETVQLSPRGCWTDALELRQALTMTSVAQAPTPVLEHWADSFGGELMEGLELPDFHDFNAFVVAEREQTRKLRARIVGELCGRLGSQPEAALQHARTWAQVDPLSFDARAGALRVLLDGGRPDEAQQHYASARRMFQELGSPRADDLRETWERLRQQSAVAHTATETGHRGGPTDGADAADAAEAPPTAASPSVAMAVGEGLALIGRDAERAELQAAVQRVVTSRTLQSVLLLGEPGIGKSRLIEDLVEHAAAVGGSVLRGAAFEAESGRPYGPFIDALRGLGGEQASDLAPLLPELGGAPAEATRERLFAAVSDLIAVRAHQAPPVVLILDDVQWLDHASAELLHFVVRNSLHRPLAIILAARPDELADNTAVTRVLRALRRERRLLDRPLAPLSPEAVHTLVQQVRDSAAPQQVVEQSGGNPLFALELARMGGRAPGQQSTQRVAESVAEVVRERIERLAAEPMDVLRWGSVLGGSFDVERLRSLMALDEESLVGALEDLERRSLVLRAQPADAMRYRFAHDVVRRVVYADVSDPRRQLMHRRVAETLVARQDIDGGPIAEIAHHATLGRDHDLAATACCATGQRCHRVFANDDALVLARRGLHHAQQLEGAVRVQRTIELLELQFLAERPDDPQTLVERLRALAEEALRHELADHARLAFHLISSIHWEGGAWDDARRSTMRAELASRGASETQRVEAIAESARCLVLLERDLSHADALLMEAEHRATPLGIEPSTLRDAQGMLKLHRGELESAQALFERAYSLAGDERNRTLEYQVLEHRVMVHLESRQYALAHGVAELMLAVGQRLREGSEAPFARTALALSQYGQGELDLEALEEGLEQLRAVDAKHRLAYSLLQAARLDLDSDDPQRALQRAQESYPIGVLLERPTETLHALLTMVRAACQLGDLQAETFARTALAEGRWQDANHLAVEALSELPSAAEATPP